MSGRDRRPQRGNRGGGAAIHDQPADRREPRRVSAAPKGGGRPSYEARIERIHDHAEDTRSLFLRMTEGQSLPNWLPGMFISIGIALPGELRVLPYTIASSRA